MIGLSALIPCVFLVYCMVARRQPNPTGIIFWTALSMPVLYIIDILLNRGIQ